MGFNGSRIVGLLFGIALASPGLAQNLPAKFDCDTAASVYSELDMPQRGPQYHISGSVTGKRYRSVGRWAPSAQVKFISADKKSYAGIILVATEVAGKMALVVESGAEGKNTKAVVETLRIGEPVTFSLDVRDGKMVIQAGGQEFDRPDVGPGSSVNITCSSGEFLFENLDWQMPGVQ